MEVRAHTPRWTLSSRFIVLLVGAAVFLSACAPTAPRPDAGSLAVRPSAPKTLRIGTNREPVEGIAVFGGSGEAGQQHQWTYHAGLTAYDPQGNLLPRLARKIPSLDDGDWKVMSDGSMELTWKLRTDARWHDGTPLSAEDFVLGIQIAKDPDLPLPHTGGVLLVREVVAPDPETLVVRWAEPYFAANEGTPAEFPAVPRHIVADLYHQGDQKAFINSPYWAREFVGLGPYRLGDWAQGSFMEAIAFDDYFLGRPRIDRLIIRFFLDPSVLVTNLLSGDIDLVSIGTLKADDLVPVKTAWESTGQGSVIEMMTYVTYGRMQYRDPTAPWARDVRVRKALLHLIDRQFLAETFYPGGSSPPDLFLSRDDPVHRIAEQRGIARYPYDPLQAERLLADAGWTRGSDGAFQSGGQKLNIEVRVVANTPGNVQQGLAVVDQWRQSGLDSDIFVIAGNATNKPELKATNKGIFMQPDPITPDFLQGFITAQMQTPQNNWQGRNLSGYSNPEFDRLYGQYLNTLDISKRQSVFADLNRRAAEDALFFPLYYGSGSSTITFRRGIRGPGPSLPIQTVSTWNVHQWEID
jgi:peptide/nickel transport system substrate-binding protein